MYFFYYQDMIPEGSGYEVLSATHFGCLAAVGAVMTVIAAFFLKSGKKGRDRIIKGIPIFLLGMEASKWIVLFSEHRANIGMLPLHLCGLAVYDFLLASFLPYRKAQGFFGEVAVILLGPGSVFALLLPDWTFYPVWNFFNLYGYIWHELLLLYPILLLMDRRVSPSVRHLWYEILFLAVIVPPVLAFDRTFDCNYLFVNWPEPGTPLSWLASFMGNPGYLAGYAVMTVAVMLLVYLPFELARKVRTGK